VPGLTNGHVETIFAAKLRRKPAVEVTCMHSLFKCYMYLCVHELACVHVSPLVHSY